MNEAGPTSRLELHSNTINSDTYPEALIQHKPNIGIEYQTIGLGGQRIAVIGYSHWKGELDGEDNPEFTESVIKRVTDGCIRTSFFTRIRNYFGFSDHADFWNKVVFFNYLPRCIGGPNERHARGTKADHDEGNERFRRIVREWKPKKVVVFSAKAWDSPMPPFDASLKGFSTDGVVGAMRPAPYGVYEADGHTAWAFGLRHPQGAPGHQMRMAVQRILAFRSSRTNDISA